MAATAAGLGYPADMGDFRNIFLVGPMGSGKTAVGKQLARRLRLPFVDSDQEIERRTGVDIPFIFDKEGEAGFRTRESAVILELAARPGLVLSTGGGETGESFEKPANGAGSQQGIGEWCDS